MSFIKGIDRNQKMMFPEYIEDYISEDNPIKVIDEYVDTLDFEKLGFTKTKEFRRGAPGYHTSTLLKLYIYGYMYAIRSSRKLETETKRNIEVIWLLRKLQPDFKTIADFRKDNKSSLKKVFKDFTLLCKQLELYGETLIAVDGTKIKADNSKRNNFNQKKIDRQIKYIDEKTNEYLMALDRCDSKEETHQTYTPEQLNNKIELMKQRREQYEQLSKRLEETGEREISTIDPDSRLMENKKNGLEMAYNLQTVVDSKHNLIVDYDITTNAADQGNLNNMAEKAKALFGIDEIEVLADKGYYQAADLKKCEENKTTTYVAKQSYANSTNDRDFYSDRFKYEKERDLYICPANQELRRIKSRKVNIKQVKYRNNDACQKCEFKIRCTTAKSGRSLSRSDDQDFLDTVDARTKENMAKYTRRQMIVEHPFGTIKRTMNGSYYLCRGKEAVSTETALILLAYNLKRVVNIVGVANLRRKIAEFRAIFLLNSRYELFLR